MTTDYIKLIQKEIKQADFHLNMAYCFRVLMANDLKKKIDLESISLRSMATKLSITPSYLSDIFKNKRPISDNLLKKVQVFLNK